MAGGLGVGIQGIDITTHFSLLINRWFSFINSVNGKVVSPQFKGPLIGSRSTVTIARHRI
jgi:hypothetical protein